MDVVRILHRLNIAHLDLRKDNICASATTAGLELVYSSTWIGAVKHLKSKWRRQMGLTGLEPHPFVLHQLQLSLNHCDLSIYSALYACIVTRMMSFNGYVGRGPSNVHADCMLRKSDDLFFEHFVLFSACSDSAQPIWARPFPLWPRCTCIYMHARGVTSNKAEEALASCTIKLQVSCDSPH